MTAPNAGSPRPGPPSAPLGRVTGGARLDDARPGDAAAESSALVARARAMRGRPLSEHADTYDGIHAELHRSLAGIDTH